MRDPFEQFRQASKLGSLALLRLRAEILLERETNEFTVAPTEEERELLHRIASAPREEDREFLGTFDDRVKFDDEEDSR